MTMVTKVFDIAIMVCGIVTIIILLSMVTGIGNKTIIKIMTMFPILQYIIPAMVAIGIINAVMHA